MIQKNAIVRLGKIITICAFVVMITVIIGCDGTKDNYTEIISSNSIDNISVELFDGSKRIFEGNTISVITETINRATLTEKVSVQDTPDSLPLGKITIDNDKEIIYYYQKDNKYYIEKPYVAIYETTVDINSFLLELTDYKIITCEEFGEFIIPNEESFQITKSKKEDYYQILINNINATEIKEYVNYLKTNNYNVEKSNISKLSFNWLLKKDLQFVSISYSENSASIYISSID